VGIAAISVVLHVPYTYFPDACGGTEVYVRALAQQLARRGHMCAIAAPGSAAAEYEDAGITVYRFAVDRRPRLARAYGVPDELAAEGFRVIVAKLQPRIVHLHARTAAVSELLIDIAHAAGARVVFTYHTPTVSCARGTMLLYGMEPCDGVIEARRCTTCTLSARGAPMPLARLIAGIPPGLLRAVATWGIEAKPLSALRIPGLLAGSGQSFRDFVGKVDHVVAVCQWVWDVLARNGVEAEKVSLSRQGISAIAPMQPRRRLDSLDHTWSLRIAYFGRVDRAKGPDLLAHALRLAPAARVQIDIYAVRQPGSEQDIAWLEAEAQWDRRLRVFGGVPPGDVMNVMMEYDLIAIPSRWLETGPLVALEAFAAGVPVLGSNLGGIAELIHDGIDGILLRADDAIVWAKEISRLAGNSEIVAELRTNIQRPRAMDECAKDMAGLYANLTANSRLLASYTQG
jgi:glycosyltransferase involved in cell wall biosynthesis